MAPTRLRLLDFSDREFLALCVEALDAEGWFNSEDVANKKELSSLDSKNPVRNVSIRCSWLWRYGVLEREHLWDEHGNPLYVAGDKKRPRWGQRWRLTEIGAALLDGRLLAHQRRTLDKIEGHRLLALTSAFAAQLAEAPEEARNLMLREWRYRTQDVRTTITRRP